MRASPRALNDRHDPAEISESIIVALDQLKQGEGVTGEPRTVLDGLNHWIPRPLFQTRLYHPALAGAPPRPSLQTRLYRPHPCGREEGNWNHFGGIGITARELEPLRLQRRGIGTTVAWESSDVFKPFLPAAGGRE